MQKIELKPLPLKNQKPTKLGRCYIELHDAYLQHIWEFYAEEPINIEDPELGWESVLNYYEFIAIKPKISGIQKEYLPKDKYWGIYIMITGFGDDLKMHFEKKERADEVFKILMDWLIN